KMKKQDKKNLNTIGSNASKALEKAEGAISREEFEHFKRRIRMKIKESICAVGVFIFLLSIYFDYIAALLQKTRMFSIHYNEGMSWGQVVGMGLGVALMIIGSWKVEYTEEDTLMRGGSFKKMAKK
ncbi:hypothetical protein LCGC14_2932130, partial [marine sediment metagenome]